MYKDNSTTQSTSGVTLIADFDGVVGLNHVTIDTSADATFYANGSHYELVITTGTVGGTSVVGEDVGSFDLAASTAAPTAADIWAYATRTLTALPAIPDGWLTAAGIASGALNGKGDWSTLTASGVWLNATRTLSAGTNIVLTKGIGVTGFTDLDAAGVRSAVGLASANLDAQFGRCLWRPRSPTSSWAGTSRAAPTAAEPSPRRWPSCGTSGRSAAAR